MPVVSPSRYSSATSSSLSSGSYRSTLTSSSSLDKPYYRSSSGTYVSSTLRTGYGDKTTEYRSRYSDVDGKRERKSSLVEYNRTSRAPSISETDSGISTRYRSDRSESRTRDVSTTRSESSKSTADPLPRPKRNVISSAALAMSTAELYNKYSPANYIPLSQRIAQAQSNNYGEISRSKSISNDIGRPPASDNGRVTRKPRNSMAGTISERPDPSRWHKEASPSRNYSKRGSMTNGVTDSNGNEVPSVSEIRKRFDPKMTVTKLPTNDTRYSPKSNLDHYLNQWKNSENGYTKLSNDDKPVPVHLPSVEKNGRDLKSSSSSDTSISKTVSEPVSLAKPVDKPEMSTSLTTKLPSDRLASIRSQLDPNNPIGKILEKSTVIQVENGDADYKERKRYVKTNSDSLKPKEKVNDVKTPKHTNSSDIANHKIKIDVNKDPKESHINGKNNKLKYIDTDHSLDLENDIESPSGTGFENQTFEHENFLMKRGNDEVDCKVQEIADRVLVNGDAEKRMDTSTESTTSDLTEDLSDSSSRRNNLEKDFEDSKSELAGGKSGPSGVRRSNDRSINNEDCGTQSCGLNGLRNIGNTCFMNSVLQCMSNTRPLLEYVSDDQYLSDINTTLSCMKGALIKAFASLIKELWRPGERDSVVNTTTFKSQVQRFAPRFMGYSQQDAQEFLRYLLEGLHEDVNRVTIKPKPILTEIDESLSDSAKAIEAWSRYQRMEDSRVGDIFVGQLKSTLRCTHCRHDSVTFDPFWDLSLPIPSRTGNHKLQQCLQHFTKEEEMDGDEKPTCSKCGVRRKCLKWFTVHKFPQVLVLHLKRFSPTERFRGKLNVVVEFPLNGLDMSPYAAGKGQQAMYNLYAVSNHSGTTYSGHYTAYCKHPYNGEWHEYNDSRVTPISSRNVVSAEAYVLFYELVKTNT